MFVFFSSKGSTLSFFALVTQARLLSQQQLDEINKHELYGFNGHCHRPAFKTSSPSQDTVSNSQADKFHKTDLNAEEEKSLEDSEFYLQEETSHDCCSDHIGTDQEVPMQEVSVDHPERLSAETNELTWKPSTHTENTLTHGASDNGISCGKLFCSKFAQSKETAEDSERTKQGFGISCLTNNEAEIIPDPLQKQEDLRTRSEYVVPNIGYKFPLLPLEKAQETELCSSLRNIDERHLIDEVSNFIL